MEEVERKWLYERYRHDESTKAAPGISMTPTSWNPIEATRALAGQIQTTLTPHNVALPPETKILLFKKLAMYTVNLHSRGYSILSTLLVTHAKRTQWHLASPNIERRHLGQKTQCIFVSSTPRRSSRDSRVCRLARALESHCV
jgi:hypothetical protein